jgi:hypothetical protein
MLVRGVHQLAYCILWHTLALIHLLKVKNHTLVTGVQKPGSSMTFMAILVSSRTKCRLLYLRRLKVGRYFAERLKTCTISGKKKPIPLEELKADRAAK